MIYNLFILFQHSQQTLFLHITARNVIILQLTISARSFNSEQNKCRLSVLTYASLLHNARHLHSLATLQLQIAPAVRIHLAIQLTGFSWLPFVSGIFHRAIHLRQFCFYCVCVCVRMRCMSSCVFVRLWEALVRIDCIAIH